MSTSSPAVESRIVLRLRHDFNRGRNEGGFHEVALDQWLEGNVRTGDHVVIADLDDTSVEPVRGRVRCIVAVVEDVL